jgi:hypothetical protein
VGHLAAILGLELDDAARVHRAGGEMACRDEVLEPLRRVEVELVVDDAPYHGFTSSAEHRV